MSEQKISQDWRGLTNRGSIRPRIEITDAQVQAIIDKMIKQRKDSITQFAGSLPQLRGDIADATRKGIDKSREAAQQLGERAGEYYESTRERAAEYYSQATEKASDLYSQAAEN